MPAGRKRGWVEESGARLVTVECSVMKELAFNA